MYCNKCGKENKDGARFCAYCGNELKIIQKDMSLESLSCTLKSEKPIVYSGVKASDIILLILYVIWAIPWTYDAVLNYEVTKRAFDLLDTETVAMVCYVLPCILALLIAVFGIIQVFQRRYYITMGILAMLLSVVIRIGRAIFNDLTFDTTKMIGYRVFLVYGTEWFFPLIIGAILTVYLYAKRTQR